MTTATGYEWVEEGSDWALADSPKPCRWGSRYNGFCKLPSVAKLYRAGHGWVGTWWHYCAAHMYGREVRDGKVMVERRVLGREDGR